MEIELKYRVENSDQFGKILNDSWIRRLAEQRSAEAIQMKAAYFDTEDRILTQNNIAFRIRQEGSRTVGTLKWDDRDEGIRGLYIRSEVNVPVDDAACFICPNPAIFNESTEGKDLLEVIGSKPLECLFDMYFTRTSRRLDYGESILELSLDEGQINAGNLTLPILELEIELFTGEKSDLLALGNKLAAKYSLEPELQTKFARGVELLAQESL